MIRRRVESSEEEDTDVRGMTQRLEDILKDSSGENALAHAQGTHKMSVHTEALFTPFYFFTSFAHMDAGRLLAAG